MNGRERMDHLISIIVPTYNSERYIGETLNSLLKQTYTNFEAVIVDDCSSDDTIDIIKETIGEDKRFKLIQNKVNSGAAVSRNRAIDNTSGDYIAFLDADDIWNCNKLRSQIEFMSNNGFLFSFTAYELIDAESRPLGTTVDLNNQSKVSYRDMLEKKATLGCSTVMLRRDVFRHLRMPNIRTGQDYATWLQALKDINYAHCLNQVLTQYRITPGSISRNKIKKAKRQWHIYREIENIPLLQSCYYFCHYSFRAVFRK